MIKKPFRETAKRLFASYAIVLLTIGLMLPIYVVSYQNARELIEWQMRSETSQGFARFINALTAVNDQMYNLRNDNQVLRLAFNSDEDSQRYRNLYYYNNTRSNFLLSDGILDMFVQFRANNILLTYKRSVLKKQDAYEISYGYEGVSYEQWQSWIRENKLFWPARIVYSIDTKPEECITYNWCSIADRADTVMICTLIRTQFIKDSLGFAREAGEFVYLAQRDGTILFSEGYPDSVPLENVKNGTIELNGQNYTLAVMKDDALNLIAVRGMPASIYSTAMQPVTRTMLLYISLALCAAAAVTLIYGYYHYKSLMPLMDYLDSNNLLDGKHNLFEQIRSALQTLDTRGEVLRRDYRRALRQCRTLAFDHALSGLPLDEEDQSLLNRWPMLTKQYVLIFINQINTLPHLMPSACSAALKSLAEEMWNQSYLHIISVQQWVCVIPNTEFIKEEITLFASKAYNELKTTFLYGVSMVQQGVEMLCTAEEQASYAVMNATHDQPIVFYIPQSSQVRVVAPFAQYKNLQEQLQVGSKEKVTALLDFFEQYIQSPDLDLPQKQNILFNLECALHLTIDLDLWEDEENRNNSNLPLHTRMRYIREAALEHCIRLAQRRQNVDSVRIEQILGYISANYHDSMLCLSSLAEEFHMSESRISQYIKTYTGRNYTVLLEEKRMQEAMLLLHDTDMSIDDISVKVGYANKNTFYKSFKRYYGAPPNSYRKGMIHK